MNIKLLLMQPSIATSSHSRERDSKSHVSGNWGMVLAERKLDLQACLVATHRKRNPFWSAIWLFVGHSPYTQIHTGRIAGHFLYKTYIMDLKDATTVS